MHVGYRFGTGDEALIGAVASLMGIPGFVIQVAVYVFSCLALYTIAKRRGLNNPWLSWIPVANVWILGSIADQYRYVARGEVRSKRKVLLTLKIISAALTAVMVVLCIGAVAGAIGGAVVGRNEDLIVRSVMGSLVGVVGLALPLVGVTIAAAIIRYMALYDLYSSCDPDNKTVFVVLSILFSITVPVFLFLCRNKDYGMPPRREV
ncbi:MAG: hypothetical protein ACI4PL_05980 [Faecousia sp.]